MMLVMSAEVDRITEELDANGYAFTSYDELDLPFDRDLVGRLCLASANGAFSPQAAELTKHINKAHMTIIQEDWALTMGREIVRPVVDSLFVDSPRARANWNLYAVNHYSRPDATLGTHQDSVGATVLVVSMSGARDFHFYDRPEHEGQELTLRESRLVTPGEVVVIDAQADPFHSVVCVEAPSVSAVLDIPDMLRSQGRQA